eukprot:gene31226-6376_t
MVPVHNSITMDGSFDQCLREAVDENGIRLIALQLPTGMRSTPAHVVSFLSSSHAAVMLQLPTGMRSTPAYVISFLSSSHATDMVLQGETSIPTLDHPAH